MRAALAARSYAAMRAAGQVLRLTMFVAFLAAVSLRLMTPPGWMPNPQGPATSPLVICTGAGTRIVGGETPPKPAKAHDACVFAGFAASSAPDLPTLTASAAVEV
ncbi:MAG: hypothetical protein ACHP7N_08920, partial [Caulobacterales bacterium]